MSNDRTDSGQDGPSSPARPLQPPASSWSDPAPPDTTLRGPGGAARPWLVGGGALVVVVAVCGVLVGVLGGDDQGAAKSAATQNPAQVAKEKTFKTAPEECQLVKPDTLARIVPAGRCTPTPFSGEGPGGFLRMPSWESDSGSTLDVNLRIGSAAKSHYDMDKESALTGLKDMQTITGSRAVDGIGGTAYLIHAVDKEPFSLRNATLVVKESNATFTIKYTYGADSGLSEQQAEQYVTDAARDVLGSLT
ncbi:hypothetical protein PUR34_14215 [Streptomyces sp. JV185]|uniref:hypothetical protein n=1 Tax=Streptomyces sp. JV185 TaxID=858638 RepID=UPI002E79BCBF|nr:hypothetical protein [Streptomyces sp. JV185]MEE1769274.1 hypothetical protein [Streptomyces sp. JV185]